jgi:hypothetical protein
MNLVCTNIDSNSPYVQRPLRFLSTLQKENGSWRENPKLSKEKLPFWSSSEKRVPILTADCIEAFIEAGYRNDTRVIRAVEWLKQMQSPTGMWLSLEDTDPNDTEPDSTQRAISALIRFGLQKILPSEIAYDYNPLYTLSYQTIRSFGYLATMNQDLRVRLEKTFDKIYAYNRAGLC